MLKQLSRSDLLELVIDVNPSRTTTPHANRTTTTNPANETSFAAACTQVLDVLLQTSGMEQWFVTRTTKYRQRLIARAGSAIALDARTEWNLAETLCARMLGGAPRSCADVTGSPDYALSPIARRKGVVAYVGAPIADVDGSVFGTLIGIDTRAGTCVSESLEQQVALFADLLASRVTHERIHDQTELTDAELDRVTGYLRGNSFDLSFADAERRVRILGDDFAVIGIELGDLVDARRRFGADSVDEAVRELAYALRVAGACVLGRPTDHRLAAVVPVTADTNLERIVVDVASVVDSVQREAVISPTLSAERARWTDAEPLRCASLRVARTLDAARCHHDAVVELV